MRRRRIQCGLTQGELAEAAEVDPTYVQRLERGLANLTLRTLARFADALDIAAFELLRPVAEPAERKAGRPQGMALAANRRRKRERKK